MDESSVVWIAYIATRSIWKKEKFAKEFPEEEQSRNTLREETESLHEAALLIRVLISQKKTVAKGMELLNKLEQEGLLESFILLGLPDGEIVEDHFEYMKANRGKLREYVNTYILHK